MYEGPKAKFSMLSGHNQGSLDNAEDLVALRASSIFLPNHFCDYNDPNIQVRHITRNFQAKRSVYGTGYLI